ncbi:DNA endonuclease RBBP8 [Bombina bombina]|uniref:DNA endonuclease RBBP8 n=1 Tax=Bombina bombina TaxID=8345 RepID=UPI00235AFFBA|nr:DNA endonuclease RBBP8 [Bombina bombina]
MNMSGASCGSPTSTESLAAGDLFKELWCKLKECHDKELQELQLKITKLKKQRCLDAQRLEEFYTKNQQLREQQKSLHDTIKVLEDRLRAGLCDRCAVTEEHMMKKQQEFESIRQQNMKLITELMNEKNTLQDENKRLSDELQYMQKKTDTEQKTTGAESSADPAECEDGVIPDSPVSSFPLSMASRMRRKKENRHVRYAERTQEGPRTNESKNNPGKETLSSMQSNNRNSKDILVAETCDLELSPPLNKSERPMFNLAAVVAETLGLETHEESQSQSVLSHLGSSSEINLAHTKHQDDSQRQMELEYSESSQNNELDINWGTQQISPVFGAAAGNIDGSLTMDTRSSPTLLHHAMKKKASNSLTHEMSRKADDVVQVTPMCASTQTKSIICQSSDSKPVLSKHIPNNGVISANDSLMTKSQDIYKQIGSRNGKRKKGENDRVVNCEMSSYNKENDIPEKGSTAIREISVDKPLDLSDRFSGQHIEEKSYEDTKNTKQTFVQDTLNSGSKNNSTSSVCRNFHGSSLVQIDLKEDPFQQSRMNHSNKEEHFSTRSDNKGAENDMLFEETEVGSPHQPRRKPRLMHRGCELASVLQPNPHLLMAKSTSTQGEHGKTPLENIQWSIDPGADLSQYKMELTIADTKNESQEKTDMDDMDYTYVSDSMLSKMQNHKQIEDDSPTAEDSKHQDSFSEMFDKTGYGEYVSCLQEKSPPQTLDCEEEDNLSKMKKKGVKHMKERGIEENAETYQKQKAFVEPYFQSAERWYISRLLLQHVHMKLA